jgi:hypothetical protein
MKNSTSFPTKITGKKSLNDSQTYEVSKYNLKSRTKGSSLFSGGIEGGMGLQENKGSKEV